MVTYTIRKEIELKPPPMLIKIFNTILKIEFIYLKLIHFVTFLKLLYLVDISLILNRMNKI